jgi:heat shock 70kDa protein 1/2/6/8
MTPMIRRRSFIQGKKSDRFTTTCDGQSAMQIQVFEGERARTKDNTLLGSFEVNFAPRGTPRIEVTFDVGCDYLRVSARELSTNMITKRTYILRIAFREKIWNA